MLTVDAYRQSARLSLGELVAGGRRYVSNPVAFVAFAMGLRLEPEMLTEPEWRVSTGASAGFAFFQTVMLLGIPRFYDAAHLAALGGRFALRFTGLGQAGDYTVIVINRRVVTLSGLPQDDVTGHPIIDAEIRPDAFVALCNDLFAELAQSTLEHLAARKAALSRPA